MRPGGQARCITMSSRLGRITKVGKEWRPQFLSATLQVEELSRLVQRFLDAVRGEDCIGQGWPTHVRESALSCHEHCLACAYVRCCAMYSPISQAYSVSKVAVNALNRVMARSMASVDTAAGVPMCHYYACCPGWVQTAMGGPDAPKTIEEGADTPIWLCTTPLSGLIDGGFYGERQRQGKQY